MAQILVPVTTDATGSWSPSTHENVDDDSTANPTGDGNFCESEMVNGSPTTMVQWGLAAGTDPESSSGHIIRVRWGGNHGGSDHPWATVRLRQGTTTIADLQEAISGDAQQTDTHLLTGTEADSIDWDGDPLNVQVFGDDFGAGPARGLRVDYVELEIPDAPGGEANEGSGTVAGVGELDGAGARAAAGSGTVAAVGDLAGDGHVDREGSGQIAAVGALQGAGARSSQGSGSVVADGVLDGTGARDAEGSGDIAAEGALVGAAGTSVQQGSGSITAEGALVGAGARPARGAGAIAADGRLAGDGHVERSGAGAVAAEGVLVGDGERDAEGAGTLAGVGALVGDGRSEPPTVFDRQVVPGSLAPSDVAGALEPAVVPATI